MSQTIVELNCPGCGARVNTGQKECDWCHKPIVISTFNSVYSMPMPEVNKYASAYRKALSENPENGDINKSIAMCYLKLKMVDKALPAFEKAIEENFDDSESYFYAAVCALGGKKAFLNQRPTIDKALEYIDAALMIEPKGIYYYLMAYIKYDYFERKHFKTSPDYQECLLMANNAGLSDYDIEQMYAILNVARPEAI
ncbi:tetratricopeptide repeat protein [Luxibacter massiliensis]|uniref:tetratricopeptide repeat protein n=1 Tax=Luxibacter massiliensis TaxID=2219695 RepID=UPI000F04BBBE|nr:tetratricopeptide repeat protein [Luxibacter massiliensis]